MTPVTITVPDGVVVRLSLRDGFRLLDTLSREGWQIQDSARAEDNAPGKGALPVAPSEQPAWGGGARVAAQPSKQDAGPPVPSKPALSTSAPHPWCLACAELGRACCRHRGSA